MCATLVLSYKWFRETRVAFAVFCSSELYTQRHNDEAKRTASFSIVTTDRNREEYFFTKLDNTNTTCLAHTPTTALENGC